MRSLQDSNLSCQSVVAPLRAACKRLVAVYHAATSHRVERNGKVCHDGQAILSLAFHPSLVLWSSSVIGTLALYAGHDNDDSSQQRSGFDHW
jgi:hypothetical protein